MKSMNHSRNEDYMKAPEWNWETQVQASHSTQEDTDIQTIKTNASQGLEFVEIILKYC